VQKSLLALAISIIVLTGCAGTAEYMRSQPVTHFPAMRTVALPEELTGLITLHCMKDQETAYVENGIAARECLYVSADARNIFGTPKDAKTGEALTDKVITFLMGLSDMNCSNFLHRAFANKAGLDFTKGFISDLAAGVSAGTAHANPTTSAALSVGNLIVGKGVESFNATYYYDKTFQALEAAVTAERTHIRTYIFAKQLKSKDVKNPVKYELVQALSDIRAYDDACSIKAGLAQLVQLANNKKKEDVNTKVQVELSNEPLETAKALLVNSLLQLPQPPKTTANPDAAR
jgi:uncharacterized lipoprotein YajG